MPVMYFPEFNNAYASLMCYLANLGNIISQSGRISLSFIFFLLLHTKIQNGWSSNFYSIKIHLIIFLVLLGELLSHSNLDVLNSTNINRPTLYQQQQDLGQWRQKVKGLKMCKQGKKKTISAWQNWKTFRRTHYWLGLLAGFENTKTGMLPLQTSLQYYVNLEFSKKILQKSAILLFWFEIFFLQQNSGRGGILSNQANLNVSYRDVRKHNL